MSSPRLASETPPSINPLEEMLEEALDNGDIMYARALHTEIARRRDAEIASRRAEQVADNRVERLSLRDMAFAAPLEMELSSAAEVALTISGEESNPRLATTISDVGKVTTQRVPVSERIEAQLEGVGFDITATTPKTQVLAASKATTWRWQIVAKKFGEQELFLSINALIPVQDEMSIRSVETFRKRVSIKVTSVAGAWAFAERFWSYIALALTAVVVPLVRYLWKKGGPPKASPPKTRTKRKRA